MSNMTKKAIHVEAKVYFCALLNKNVFFHGYYCIYTLTYHLKTRHAIFPVRTIYCLFCFFSDKPIPPIPPGSTAKVSTCDIIFILMMYYV